MPATGGRWMFWAGGLLFVAAAAATTFLVKNEYPFFAGYVVLQFIVLATAWNILGGYAGYVNFGTNSNAVENASAKNTPPSCRTS